MYFVSSDERNDSNSRSAMHISNSLLSHYDETALSLPQSSQKSLLLS